MQSSRSILLALAFALAGCAQVPRAPAWRETAAVSQIGDAADDPAIWAADDATQSLVIATQKQGGLYVFDLAGAIVQEIPGGRPNNVDLRDGFAWPEGAGPLIGASDRSDNSIVLWRFDAAARRLDPAPRARIPTGFTEVYGFCMGRMGADWIAIASDKGGEIGVWKLTLGEDGAPRGERVAAFNLGSITEGCVVDDETGVYYLAQELVGVWRVALGDASGAGKRLVDRVGEGRLFADVEGLTIWTGAGGAGYLIVSVQGRSRYAVYDRGEGNAYLGAFAIGASADGKADRVSGTDGIDVVAAPLGADLPRGLFVAQDDSNTDPAALQDFKLVSWADIEAALALAPAPMR
jgi:3-phytase